METTSIDFLKNDIPDQIGNAKKKNNIARDNLKRMRIALSLYKRGEVSLEEMQLLIPTEMLVNDIEYSNLSNSISKEPKYRLRSKNGNYVKENSFIKDEKQDGKTYFCTSLSTSPEKCLMENGKCGNDKPEGDELGKKLETCSSSKQSVSSKEPSSDSSKVSRRLEILEKLRKKCKYNRAPFKTFAECSVPDGLELKKSFLPTASVGVFTKRPIKKDTIFGPFIGETDYELESAKGGNEWEIFVDDVKHHCIVGRNVNKSNWMMFVNVPLKVEDMNLEAFQKGYKIYYRANQDIQANKELYVFYGLNYNQDLTSTDDNDEVPKKIQNTKNTTDEKEVEKKNEIKKDRIDVTKNDFFDENIYKCLFCGNISHCKFSHDLHLKKNHSNCKKKREFKCYTCGGKSFNSQHEMSIHLRTHTGEKPYTCNVCNVSFKTNSLLKIHIRSHSGEQHCARKKREFKCFACGGKSFNSLSEISTHLRTHTGERPYKCNVCNVSFTKNSRLKRHIRTQCGGLRRVKKKREFKCYTCGGKSFNSQYDISIHLRTHIGEKPYKKPYTCNVCKKSFTTNGSLKSHIRTHSGERPYVCDVCKKAFVRFDHLQTHIRTHTGERPYECVICGCSYSSRSSLNNHLCIHWRGEEVSSKNHKKDDF